MLDVQCKSNATVAIYVDAPPRAMCPEETNLWKEGVDGSKVKYMYLHLQGDSDMASMEPKVMREDDFMADNERNSFASCMKLPSEFSLVTFMVPLHDEDGHNRSACFVKESGYGMRACDFDPQFDPIKTMPAGSRGKGMFYT